MTTGTDNPKDRFLGQLDTLIAFLALAHDEVFDVIRSQYDTWVRPNEQGTLPNSAAIYRTQISHAALLLGFSYFEAFLADVARMIFRAHPKMLSPERTISYGELLRLKPDEDLIELLIEKEVSSMGNGYAEIAKYFTSRLHVEWPDHAMLAEANGLRNSIIHNNARVNEALAKVSSRWTVGQEIALSPGDVHSFGASVRRFAWDLWPKVERQLRRVS